MPSRTRNQSEEKQESRFEELSDDEQGPDRVPSEAYLPPWLSPDFLSLPVDELQTITSDADKKTQSECLPLLQLIDDQNLPFNSHGLPRLQREAHIDFLHKALGSYPAPYMALDASRPWFFYWCLQGLTALGQDVSIYRDRMITTLRPLQNATGGFAGGHGQYSHSATSYACVLALVIVDAQHTIDRKAMWEWLGRMKQPDGGFCVADMAEEDIRGAYCAMTMIALLDLPIQLPPDAPARKAGLTSFLDGLGEWIGRCQTYEGGIAGAPSYEAHGAYAFCALACLSIIDAPSRSIPRYLDVPALTRWMAGIQTSPEGGFAGRTNKLVDACYSHWVGASWTLLDAANGLSDQLSCWNRAALIRYLLTCCQQPGKKGGMRDKPSTRPDAYHTSYSLSGLSAAQHIYTYRDNGTTGAGSLAAGFNWIHRLISEVHQEDFLLDDQDIVEPVHPVFVMPFAAVEKAKTKFSGIPV